MRIAILVDGGYYRKRATKVHGYKTAKDRANELYSYVNRHLKEKQFDVEHRHELYRIFYYDCPPINKNVYHPLTGKTIDFSKSDTKSWTEDFFTELSKKRKVAMRFGELNDSDIHYNLKFETTKKLLSNNKQINELEEKDFNLNLQQKGVDMRIGLDIATLAFKQQVDKIVLIAGDSDFVPAAKLARREGIDFILDSLGSSIKDNLSLHIDGRRTCDSAYYINKNNKPAN